MDKEGFLDELILINLWGWMMKFYKRDFNVLQNFQTP